MVLLEEGMGDIRQWLETFLVVTKRKRHYWLLGIKVRDAAKPLYNAQDCPSQQRIIHPTNANSTEIETLWFKTENPVRKTLFFLCNDSFSVIVCTFAGGHVKWRFAQYANSES